MSVLLLLGLELAWVLGGAISARYMSGRVDGLSYLVCVYLWPLAAPAVMLGDWRKGRQLLLP